MCIRDSCEGGLGHWQVARVATHPELQRLGRRSTACSADLAGPGRWRPHPRIVIGLKSLVALITS
eukprot:12085679-Alexandrium_andersonii.AAC.1